MFDKISNSVKGSISDTLNSRAKTAAEKIRAKFGTDFALQLKESL